MNKQKTNYSPPPFARWLLGKILWRTNRQAIIGDFDEIYIQINIDKNRFIADLWYWWQVFYSIPSLLINSILWNRIMFINYVKITFRNLIKYKTHSSINILGLTFGITTCLIIYIFIRNEQSFDSCYKDADRIYRIGTKIKNKTGEATFAKTNVPVANVLKNDFPQIKNVVRFNGGPPQVIRLDNQKTFYEKDNYFQVDADFFEVFTIPFIFGDPTTIFKQLQTVVLSETIAKKYFGSKIPLGRTINFDKKEWKITGVFKEIPHNSHLPKFQIVSIFQFPDWASGWDGLRIPTYIKVKEKSNINNLEKKIENLAETYAGNILKQNGETIKYFLQPLKDIHLHSNFLQEYANLGSSKTIIIFSALGLIILFIACLNYINLTTARSINRGKEIGIRKVIGANKGQLFKQFLGESIVISIISIFSAIILTEILLPVLNVQLGLEMHFAYFSDFTFPILIISMILIIGILSGSYPSFILSSFRPVNILSRNYLKIGKKTTLRNYLIVFQFTMASILIIGSFVVYQQLGFMKNKDLGFDKDQMLVLPMQDQDMMQMVSKKVQTIKQEFTNHHSVISATAILRPPGRIEHHDNLELLNGGNSKIVGMNNIFVDHDFINTFSIKMVAGRAFKHEYSNDVGKAFIINESAVKAFGLQKPEEAIGKVVSHWMGNGEIIGICKDFHLWSLHRSIEPLFFFIPPKIFPEVITLKLKTEDLSETIRYLNETWEKQFPDYPFEYYFLDEDFNRQYHADEIFNRIIFLFTGIAIFIACIGLFSLVSLTIEQRTKETGIRIVLGASIFNIIFLFSQEFTKWILFANIIAWPIAWYASNKWLQNFAYKTNISFDIFIFSGVIICSILIFTVFFKALKAALMNPVQSLRYE